jgi:hypothetical protein
MKRKVIVKPIEKKHLHDVGAYSLFKGVSIRALVSVTTHRYEVDLSDKELKELGKELGINLDTKRIPGKPHPFYDSRLGTIHIGNSALVLYPDDRPLDKIKYAILKKHKWVAPSLEAYKRGEYPEAKYYIIDEKATSHAKAEKAKKKQEAIVKLKDKDIEYKKWLALSLKENISSIDNDTIIATIDEMLDKDPNMVLDMMNKDEKYLEVRGLVTEAKMLKVISKRKGSYYFMSNKLGLDIEEVVSELLDDDKLYSMVIEKVNAKKKAK